jgi:HK97 family phage major capsid protein
MSQMTTDQLKALVKELLKDVWALELEPQWKAQQAQHQNWMKELLSGGHKEDKPEKGQMVARMIRALAAAKGDPEKAQAWAKKHWDDENVVKALAAGDAVSGGFLIPEQYSADIIELLRAVAIVRKLNPIQIPMPMGTLTLPKMTGGATASYVGENRNIPVTQPQFGALRLVYKKLAALVPISNDLLRYNAYGVDAIVRDDLVAAFATREDLAFIRDDGSQFTPKGLRYWAPAPNVLDANATVNLANVTFDLARLVLQLESANVRMLRPAWILSPRSKMYLMTVRDGSGNFAFRDEMMVGRLWTFPFGSTTQIPENLGGGGDESEVYLVDMADAVIGDATSIIIDTSTEAAYHDGSQVIAAFSQDQTVVRAILQHDFGMRHDASVAVLQKVKWAPTGA